jgi:thioredoxin reductase (NADPH)
MGMTIKVYGAPWCPDCRRAKKFLSEQRVAFEWHDIELEPDGVTIVEQRNNGNHTIPTIIFDDDTSLSEPSNEELADKLGLTRRAMKDYYDLVIIGGGPTGLTTAIYAARENIDTLVIERSGLGGQAGVTERVDNYPGFPEGIGGSELADRFILQAKRYGVELLQAVGVATIKDEGDHKIIETRSGERYYAHAVLIATGSSYRKLMAPGEDDLIGAGIHFCATCDGPFYKGAKELMVIGGGNSGLEEGLFLTQFAEKVVVVEHNQNLRGSKLLQEKVLNDKRMEVLTAHRVAEFRKNEKGKLGAVVLENRATGETFERNPAGAFVFIGLDPNTQFLQGVVELTKNGFVPAEGMQTSVPGIFAAGDVRFGSTKQLASAVGEGAAAALAIRAYLDAPHM